MAKRQTEEGKENKVILTIAIVMGVVATILLVVILGSMFMQPSTGTKKSMSAPNGAADVVDHADTSSSASFVAIKTKEGVYENSNIIRGSNGIFKSASSGKDPKASKLAEEALLAQSAKDIQAQGIENYTIETYDPDGMDESSFKPKAGTITAMQEFINPSDASSIIFIYTETRRSSSSAVSVPSITGMTESDAKATLKQAGVRATTIDALNTGTGAGVVIFQSPEPSRIIPSGGTVYLIVAR